MTSIQQLKVWVKTADHPLALKLKSTHRQLRDFEIPAIHWIFNPLRLLHQLSANTIAEFMRILYWTPMFKTRLINRGKSLYLYGGMPLVLGALDVKIGAHCRISGQTTFSGRWSSAQTPLLSIGDNVGIAWQTTIAVGTKVIIGNNVRIAAKGFLAGYPGHPIDSEARAKGLPDTDDQIGDIILEDDVWLGSNVTVMKGVTIGKGTIVASGSVVTKDLPAFILAAGSPAKVIKEL